MRPTDAVVVLVNDASRLVPTKTTTALIAGLAERHPTYVVGVADLALDGDGGRARARAVASQRAVPVPGAPPTIHISLSDPVDLRLDDGARILVRTNPATGLSAPLWAHALRVLAAIQRRGGQVLNPSAALDTFATKTGLLQLPDTIRPETVVCADPTTALQTLDRLGRAVVKPVGGSQGAGVFIVRPDDPNRRTALDLLLQMGPVVVQGWIHGAEGGDVRLFLIDGEPLVIDGVPAAIARIPTGGELRSNVHLGAQPSLGSLTPALRRIADEAGPVLRAHGIRIAGLDCIGGSVVEVNACSPGGLTDLSVLAGIDAVGGFIDVLDRLFTP